MMEREDKLKSFVEFLIASMTVSQHEREAKWPVWSKEENSVYQKWKTETNYGRIRSRTDPLVESWSDARFHWFEIPKFKEILNVGS